MKLTENKKHIYDFIIVGAGVVGVYVLGENVGGGVVGTGVVGVYVLGEGVEKGDVVFPEQSSGIFQLDIHSSFQSPSSQMATIDCPLSQ